MEAYVSVISLLVVTAINGYWTWQSKRVQNDRDIIKSLQQQINFREEELKRSKTQYSHLMMEYKRAEGELKVYTKFHKHVDEDR